MKQINMVHSSIMNANEISRVLSENYALINKNLQCELYRRGMHDIYLVIDNNIKYYFKVYRNFKGYEELETEVRLINYLNENGINVCIPIKSKNGEIITIKYPESDRFAVLFSECIGSGKMNNVRCEIYGKILARIHMLFDSFDQELSSIKNYDLNTFLLGAMDQIKAVDHIISKRNIDYLDKVTRILKTKVEDLLKNETPYFGVIHGDFTHKNMLFHPDNSISIYDFDLCSLGWRVYDVSVFLWSMSDWGRRMLIKRSRYMKNFLKGYNSIRKITKEELEAVKIFIPIRDIWQMGCQAELRNLFGTEILFNNYVDMRIRRINKWIKKYNII